MDCGSGVTAANRFSAGTTDRGWKAAPTIIPTPKILKLTPIYCECDYDAARRAQRVW